MTNKKQKESSYKENIINRALEDFAEKIKEESYNVLSVRKFKYDKFTAHQRQTINEMIGEIIDKILKDSQWT